MVVVVVVEVMEHGLLAKLPVQQEMVAMVADLLVQRELLELEIHVIAKEEEELEQLGEHKFQVVFMEHMQEILPAYVPIGLQDKTEH